MSDQTSKTLRILSMFERLCKGEVIQKQVEAERFKINPKTVQRDIEEVREYLYETDCYRDSELKYDYQTKGYRLIHNQKSWFSNQEILAIAKILLESRAFSKEDMHLLLDKLLLQSTLADQKFIKDIILNERFHYIPLQNGKSSLFQPLWDLAYASKTKRKVEVYYEKEHQQLVTKRIVLPVGVIFSDYYFYLAAYIENKGFDFPTIYRIDRIKEYKVTDDHFKFDEKERFEEGNFRKKVQFMQTGNLLKIKFKFWGRSIQAVLDRLPTARIIANEGESYLIEAEVFGKGIKMWLLSQSQFIEVIEPIEFRNEIINTISEMNAIYQNV